MAEKKQDGFTVVDRRLFTTEGELRKDVAEEEPSKMAPQPAVSTQAGAGAGTSVPEAPSTAEQKQQAEAYRKSTKAMDSRVELSGESAKELEMTFERFLASLYMSAMLQLGLMHEEGGQPRLDLIGARQTIDTLSLLSEKTKGNLTATEENFLHNALYELRMAYVEVTNALTRLPKATGTNPIKR
jgi:Domain of unknown function (DUF1844)